MKPPFESVVAHHGATVLRVVRAVLGHADADDAWSEAFLAAMKAYPDLPADVLAARPLARKSLCRTFSDCTTGPRNGMISGCFPLDPFYKARPEREAIAAMTLFNWPMRVL